MILNVILGSLALLSLALLIWQWVAARRFPLHRRNADHKPGPLQPAVTLLKSLKGADASTEDCLRSWLAQNYAGEVQVLFGVASAEDPVGDIVRKLTREFPQRNIRLVVCPQLLGTNAKVSKLAELEKFAKHEILVISDADVRVPLDFLANAIISLCGPVAAAISPRTNEPVDNSTDSQGTSEVGLVNCFYRLANPTTLAMQWEAIAINADFWSQVLQSQTLKPLDFALGAVMLTRRRNLAEIGGFNSLADCLADDYQLGNRIASKGHRIVLCPVVVECWDPPMTWTAVWKHQLRWARTIRICQPAPYFFSILSNAGFWALLWLAWGMFESIRIPPNPADSHFGPSLTLSLVDGVIFLMIRMIIAGDLQYRLTRSLDCIKHLWMVPVKDFLQAAIWVCAFAGNRIEWRGQKFRLQPDGTLEPSHK